jgi:hypothetical protein
MTYLHALQDPDCLQQEVADQAFTNAKAAGDVQGQVDALIFRALERNSGAVGQTSGLCQSATATNPEIAALQQHQDPASDGAADLNKEVVLELARQIASVGGDPQDALLSGTFQPGQIGDPTAAGNTCDDQNDTEGCIFSQNLLVEDATADEIDAAVAGVAAGGNGAANNGSAADNGAAGNANDNSNNGAANSCGGANGNASADANNGNNGSAAGSDNSASDNSASTNTGSADTGSADTESAGDASNAASGANLQSFSGARECNASQSAPI